MRALARSFSVVSLLSLSVLASAACTGLLGDFEIVAKPAVTPDAGGEQPETSTPIEAGPDVDAGSADAGPTQFTASYIAAGVNHTCAVHAGNVYCWGNNDVGQLGSPPSQTSGGKSNRPLKVPNLGTGPAQGKAITKVWVGGTHSCALDLDGSLFCWGSNNANQLNTGDPVDANPHPEPKRVQSNIPATPLLTGVASAALGLNHTCAVLTNGDTMCWGYNVDGQTGDPTHVTGRTAAKVSGVAGTAVATASKDVTCAVTGGAQLYCWGRNSGQIGSTGLNTILPPTVVNMPATPFVPSAGAAHLCVTAGTPQTVYCLGDNGSGQLGNDGGSVMVPTPISVPDGGPGFDFVDVGGLTSCARGVAASPGLGCWGSNARGQLGLGTKDADRHPQVTLVPGLPPVREGEGAYSVGADHVCAITKPAVAGTGPLYCWGAGAFGKLGVDPSTTDDTFSPKAVIVPE